MHSFFAVCQDLFCSADPFWYKFLRGLTLRSPKMVIEFVHSFKAAARQAQYMQHTGNVFS